MACLDKACLLLSSIVYCLGLIRPIWFQPSRLWLGPVMLVGMSNTRSTLPLSSAAVHKSVHAELRLCRRYSIQLSFLLLLHLLFSLTPKLSETAIFCSLTSKLVESMNVVSGFSTALILESRQHCSSDGLLGRHNQRFKSEHYN